MLKRLGVAAGERVATLAWNRTHHLDLYYGVTGSGVVLHTVNPRLFGEQIAYILNHADSSHVFVDADLLPMIGALIEFDDLRKLSRLENAQLASVERWAKRVGIRYQYDGRSGIWTTLDAMNAAIGMAQEAKPDQYSIDAVP